MGREYDNPGNLFERGAIHYRRTLTSRERYAQELTSLPQLDDDLTVLLMELGSADQNYLGFGRMAAAELIVACRLRA
jgi:hypothetical protein